jgi:hypothetical protein
LSKKIFNFRNLGIKIYKNIIFYSKNLSLWLIKKLKQTINNSHEF